MAASTQTPIAVDGASRPVTKMDANVHNVEESSHKRSASLVSTDAVSQAESANSSTHAPSLKLKAREVKKKVKSRLNKLKDHSKDDNDEDGSDDSDEADEDVENAIAVEDDDDAPLAVVRDRSRSSSTHNRTSSINSKTAAQVYAERHRLEVEDDSSGHSPGMITPHARDYSDDDDDQNIIVLPSGKKQVVAPPSKPATLNKHIAPGTPLSAKAIKSPPGTANTTSTGGRSRARSSISLPQSQSDWKRRAEFHNLFEGKVDEDEHLVSDYTCAWAKDILRHGRLYVGARNLAFICTIIGLKCSLVIPYVDIAKMEKTVTARVIPNAISVTTVNGDTYLLCSFVYRDTSYDLISECWRSMNPEGYNAYMKSLEAEKIDEVHDQEVNGDTTISEDHFPAESDKPVTKHQAHDATECSGDHFSETVLDVRFPSEPERIFNLLYRSDEFQRKINDNMKLTDYNTSGWTALSQPGKDGLQSREHSYVKPLNGSVGPSSAKCIISEEELVKDASKAFEMMSITKTPDVPSGGSFSVHTKTCLTWAGGSKGGCRMLVTTECVWTSRSMLKGVITSSSIAGQREYNKDVAKLVRKEIHAHPDLYGSGDTNAPEADDELAGPAADDNAQDGDAQSSQSANGRATGAFRPYESFVKTLQTSQAAVSLLLLSNIALLAWLLMSATLRGWPGKHVAVHKVVLSAHEETLALAKLQKMEQSWAAFQRCVKQLAEDAA